METSRNDRLPKRVTYLERLPRLPPADFRAHWAGPHAEIARHFPGLVAYRQGHVIDRAPADGVTDPYPVDGIVELWFADDDAVVASARSDVVPQLLEDEPRFLSALDGAAVSAPRPDAAIAPFAVWVLAAWTPGADRTATVDRIERVGHELGLATAVNERDEAATPLARETLRQDPDFPALAVCFPLANRADAEQTADIVRGQLGAAGGLRRATVLVTEQLRIV